MFVALESIGIVQSNYLVVIGDGILVAANLIKCPFQGTCSLISAAMLRTIP